MHPSFPSSCSLAVEGLFQRDLTIACLKALYQGTERKVDVLDALSGTGLRALRIALEGVLRIARGRVSPRAHMLAERDKGLESQP